MNLKHFFLLLFFIQFFRLQAQESELEKRLAKASDAEKVFIYDEYAQKYKDTNPTQALSWAEKGLMVAQKVKDTASVAYYYTFIGVLHKNMGNYEEALMYYQKAIPINEQIKNLQGNAGIYNNIAFVYRLQGKYKKSLEFYLQALAFFENSNNTKHQSNVLNNIGSLYTDQKNYLKAIEFFEKSLVIAEQIKDTLGIAFAYNNLGEVYQKQNRRQEAKSYFQKSLIWKKKKNHSRSIASGYANMALVLQEEAKYDSSLYYLKESLAIYEKIEDLNGQVETLLRLGELQNRQNDMKKAFESYQKALELSKKIGSKPLTTKAYEFLAEYYAKQKNYDKAYQFRLLYDRTKDSLMSLEQLRQINELQARYDDQAQKQQIELLKTEKKIVLLEKTAETKQKWLLAIGLLVVMLLAVSLFWAYRLKQKSNRQLNQQNMLIQEALNQKEMLLREIHHRVKNNLQIISSLLHLQAHKGQNPQDLLQQSQDRIQAMAIIHEKLYKSDNLQAISLAEYIENLVTYFQQTYSLEQRKIRVETHLEHIHLDIDKLIPCGLILNELLTNSIKYAFKEHEKGTIAIWAKMKDNRCVIEIKDDGVGLPETLNLKQHKSLGLRLVDGLVRQIKGVWDYRSHQGACFSISFEPTLQNV
jgi:two-component sensor histidine kinase